MESFLAGRATVAKLPPSAGGPVPSGDGFAPLFAPRPEPVSPTAKVVTPPHDAAPATPATEHAHDVRVEVVRVDGAVQGIVVTCRCGERIELDCVY